jgi:hypothetical protein
MLSLLGGTRGQGEKPGMGKNEEGLGLKLEDAWEPPVSEDEEGDDDDGEGEEEEEGEDDE